MKGITRKRKEQLVQLEAKIGFGFKKRYILNRALTHSSYANQWGLSYVEHNERLEFLGDSVLNLVISEYIFKKYRNKPEGKLTRIRANIVCEASLYERARKIRLGDYMLIGRGEEITGGRERVSLLADAYEALIAAIYIDGGFDSAKDFIISELAESIENIGREAHIKDYKSRLQEYVQKDQGLSVKYEVVNEEGPAHNKTFYVKAIVNNKIAGSGHGRSKKEAEQEAAKSALSLLEDIN